jgi:ATP-binding cassette subfamily F protein 3
VREERAREASAPKPTPAPRKPAPRKPPPDAQRLEREIEAAEAALRELEDELADPAAWADPKRSARATKRHASAKRAVDELYEQWERVAG